MSTTALRVQQGACPATGGAVARRRWLIRAFDLLLTWQERASQRHRLLALDHHRLRDIGLSRADVELEAAKPFWRA